MLEVKLEDLTRLGWPERPLWLAVDGQCVALADLEVEERGHWEEPARRLCQFSPRHRCLGDAFAPADLTHSPGTFRLLTAQLAS